MGEALVVSTEIGPVELLASPIDLGVAGKLVPIAEPIAQGRNVFTPALHINAAPNSKHSGVRPVDVLRRP